MEAKETYHGSKRGLLTRRTSASEPSTPAPLPAHIPPPPPCVCSFGSFSFASCLLLLLACAGVILCCFRGGLEDDGRVAVCGGGCVGRIGGGGAEARRTEASVNSDLLWRQKRPTMEAKKTCEHHKPAEPRSRRTSTSSLSCFLSSVATLKKFSKVRVVVYLLDRVTAESTKWYICWIITTESTMILYIKYYDSQQKVPSHYTESAYETAHTESTTFENTHVY